VVNNGHYYSGGIVFVYARDVISFACMCHVPSRLECSVVCCYVVSVFLTVDWYVLTVDVDILQLFNVAK